MLGPKGVLKRKTRILVTHGIAYLPQVDNIVVLKDGEVSEMGTYKELLERKGAFAEFLQHHITEEDVSELEDPALIEELKSVVGISPHLTKGKSRRISESSDAGSDAGGMRRRISSARSLEGSMSRSGSVRRGEELRRHAGSLQGGKDRLIEVEKSETDSVKMAVYMDYFRAAGWHMSVGTFALYFVYQGEYRTQNFLKFREN